MENDKVPKIKIFNNVDDFISNYLPTYYEKYYIEEQPPFLKGQKDASFTINSVEKEIKTHINN